MSLSYEKKTWSDAEQSGTAIEASDLNKFESTLSDVVSTLNSLPKIYVGTKVCTVWGSNGQLKIFDANEYKAIVGRGFLAETDCVLVMNGHFNANQRYLSTAAVYIENDKSYSIWAQTLSNLGTEQIRVNYVIICNK